VRAEGVQRGVQSGRVHFFLLCVRLRQNQVISSSARLPGGDVAAARCSLRVSLVRSPRFVLSVLDHIMVWRAGVSLQDGVGAVTGKVCKQTGGAQRQEVGVQLAVLDFALGNRGEVCGRPRPRFLFARPWRSCSRGACQWTSLWTEPALTFGVARYNCSRSWHGRRSDRVGCCGCHPGCCARGRRRRHDGRGRVLCISRTRFTTMPR
jgi:hypothetical protein